VNHPNGSTRRIDATGRHIERPDLLIHALAQLADNVVLVLPEDAPDRPSLELLARAYGILERVRFQPSSERGGELRIPPTMAELIHELSDPGDAPAACRARDEILARHRVAIVTNLPAPYRIPLLGKMAGRLERVGAELRVFFMRSQTRGRPWVGQTEVGEFEHESLTSIELPIGVRGSLVPINLERRLSAFDPTILLAGSLSPFVCGRAIRVARRREAIFGIWSGEIAGRPTSASRLRRLTRAWLTQHSDFAIAYGFLAGEYLRGLRPDLPFVYGRNTSHAHAVDGERRAGSGAVRLLAVADMAKPGKGIGLLVEALDALPSLECSLTVIGPGAEASGLQERARSDDRISFLGALPQDEVRRWYAQSDVFLFPSSAAADPFGLALVEAMGSGLVPIASSTPGAIADVGVDGLNCVVVRDREPQAWAAAIERVVLDADLRLSLGENAARTIRSRWTVDHACDAMVAGLRLGALSTAKASVASRDSLARDAAVTA
jgi:glycosyltransferase involved in cell wall biosynthesis